MKRTIMTVFLLGMLALGQSAAAQQDEVREAMVASLAAWTAGDFETLGNYYAPQTRGFMLDGGFLITGYNPAALQAAVDAGFSFSLEAKDIDIVIIGETVAVSVAYVEGSVTTPGAEPQGGEWRYSETRVKEGGFWKVVQYHFSPLEVPEF